MGLLKKLRQKGKQRAVVVGLDGVPYTLLAELTARGQIPHMASIFDTGYFGQMSVCIPEISSVSWSSFMTGTQSGEHGIFGFVDLQPGTYKMYFPNFTHLKAATLWDDLGTLGKKSVVINMPATYPAREIEGALISGFVAIDMNKAVYPPSFIPVLSSFGYKIDVDTVKGRQDSEFLFLDLRATLESRQRAVDLLWKEVDWDLFIVVVTGTDRLLHFIFDAFEEEAHPYHQEFLDYFERVDGFVGHVYDRFMALDGSKEGRNQFYMLSDHGFTKIKAEVYLNRWLQENGYLRFERQQPQTIMDIGAGSIAFNMDPSRIYVNRRGRYPLGSVDPTDYERVRRELKQGFEELTFNGDNRIIKRVYLKEELYEGAYVDQAPDLVVLPQYGYDLKGKVNSNTVFGHTNLVGMHTQDDAFFSSSSGVSCRSIFDAKAIILHGLGSPVRVGQN